MTDREKLIEILRKTIFPHELADPTEAVADYLLDNGVTVQRWIPVTADTAPEKFVHVQCYFPEKDYGSKIMISYNECEKGRFPYFCSEHLCGHPSHWMPLPEPPEEE